MSASLPHLLFPGDTFSVAELSALRLAGELCPVADAFAPPDHPDSRRLRAESLRPALPPHAIVELQTAQWLWAARSTPPSPVTVCIPAGGSQRPSSTLALRMREVVLSPSDVVMLHGVRVTSPLRTVTDLLRIEPSLTDADMRQLAALLHSFGHTPSDARDLLARLGSLPHKLRATRSLTRLSTPSLQWGAPST